MGKRVDITSPQKPILKSDKPCRIKEQLSREMMLKALEAKSVPRGWSKGIVEKER